MLRYVNKKLIANATMRDQFCSRCFSITSLHYQSILRNNKVYGNRRDVLIYSDFYPISFKLIHNGGYPAIFSFLTHSGKSTPQITSILHRKKSSYSKKRWSRCGRKMKFSKSKRVVRIKATNEAYEQIEGRPIFEAIFLCNLKTRIFWMKWSLAMESTSNFCPEKVYLEEF